MKRMELVLVVSFLALVFGPIFYLLYYLHCSQAWPS